jgi:alcohol dehydrogenase class IV
VVVEYREPFEPTYQYLDRISHIVRACDGASVDVVVGIGGGSVLDTAKALATLATNPGESLKYRGFPSGITPPIPTVAVPTTAGTGSEVAYNAVFTDEREQKKLGINSVLNYPVVSILDPLCIIGAPRSVIVSSGLDALVHTLEGFTSRKASSVSRAFSREAFRRIIRHLEPLAQDTESLADAQEMQIGAAFAMLGMANSSSGIAGAMSYHIGTHFKVAHGVAGGVFIPQVMRLVHDHGWHGLADLADLLPDGLGRARRVEARSARVVASIESLVKRVGMPQTLNPLGIGADALEGCVTFANTTMRGARDLTPATLSDQVIAGWLEKMTTGTSN